jgi:hypothetical protein
VELVKVKPEVSPRRPTRFDGRWTAWEVLVVAGLSAAAGLCLAGFINSAGGALW